MHKVESSTDYKKFKLMPGNRPIGKRVNRLIRKVKEKNMLAQFPILCVRNGTGFYIADGQHRFEAAKALGLPVFYTEGKDITIEDIQKANGEQKAWNMKDYLASWIDRGNKQYEILKRFAEEYQIPLSVGSNILSGIGSGRDQVTIFREGRFVATRNLKTAERVAALIRSIRPFLPFTMDRSLGIALVNLMLIPSFDPARFLHKLETGGRMLRKCATWAQYVDEIEAIYNFRVRPNQLVALVMEARKVARPSIIKRKAA